MRVSMMRVSLLVLCWAAMLAPLPGATLEQLSLDDLIQKSTAIVKAKVVDSYADFRGKELFTHWKLQVENQWKGETTAEVLAPGGSLRGNRQSVPGAPQLTVGKEYVLFLWKSKSGTVHLTGWGQGVFELHRDAAGKLLATRAAVGETIVEHGTWRPLPDGGLEVPYADLEARIKGAGR